MGLTKMLSKDRKKLQPVFIAEATFEEWEKKPSEAIEEFMKEMIAQLQKDFPLYRYVKSDFEYKHNGNIDFRFLMRLKEFKSSFRK